jgi:hypothetical protein
VILVVLSDAVLTVNSNNQVATRLVDRARKYIRRAHQTTSNSLQKARRSSPSSLTRLRARLQRTHGNSTAIRMCKVPAILPPVSRQEDVPQRHFENRYRPHHHSTFTRSPQQHPGRLRHHATKRENRPIRIPSRHHMQCPGLECRLEDRPRTCRHTQAHPRLQREDAIFHGQVRCIDVLYHLTLTLTPQVLCQKAHRQTHPARLLGFRNRHTALHAPRRPP